MISPSGVILIPHLFSLHSRGPSKRGGILPGAQGRFSEQSGRGEAPAEHSGGRAARMQDDRVQEDVPSRLSPFIPSISQTSPVLLALLVSFGLTFRLFKDGTVARMSGGAGQAENRK